MGPLQPSSQPHPDLDPDQLSPEATGSLVLAALSAVTASATRAGYTHTAAVVTSAGVKGHEGLWLLHLITSDLLSFPEPPDGTIRRFLAQLSSMATPPPPTQRGENEAAS